MRWTGHVARTGKQRNAYRLLVGKSERSRPLGRSRLKCVDNIKITLVEIGLVDMAWLTIGYIWRVL
jgi:hypothetical protein